MGTYEKSNNNVNTNNMRNNAMGNNIMNNNIMNNNNMRNNAVNNNGAVYGRTNGEKINFFLHKCPSCGAPLKVKYGTASVTCEYCGYTSLIAPSETEQIESQKIAKNSNRKSNAILLIVLIPLLLVFFLSMLVAFNTGYRASGIIGLIQCVCVITGLVSGLGKKVNGARVAILSVAVILSFVLVVPYFQTMWSEDEKRANKAREEAEEENLVSLNTTWPDAGIGEVVPRPELEEAHIWDNTDKGLSLRAPSVTQEFYEEYREECIKSGFTENVHEGNNSYYAYTKDGYYISILLTEEDEFYLTAKTPIELNHYLWPESGVGSLLPEPDNEYGRITEDRNRSFAAEIYQVSEENFEAYIQACKDAGFTEDVQQRSDAFTAVDKDGNIVDLFLYSDFYCTMSVRVQIADNEE